MGQGDSDSHAVGIGKFLTGGESPRPLVNPMIPGWIRSLFRLPVADSIVWMGKDLRAGVYPYAMRTLARIDPCPGDGL